MEGLLHVYLRQSWPLCLQGNAAHIFAFPLILQKVIRRDSEEAIENQNN